MKDLIKRLRKNADDVENTESGWGPADRLCKAAREAAAALTASAQPTPPGYQIVPIEVVNLFNFMNTAFVPMTSQQEQIQISLDLARKAMHAAANRKSK